MSSRPNPPRSRRRATRRQYMARRVVALGTAVLLVVVGVALGRSVFGGDTSTTAAPPNSVSVTTDASTPSSDPVTGTGASVVAETSTSVAPTAIPDTAVPSATNKLTLYIAGDSDAGTFAPYLERLLKQTGMVATTLDYKVSSGLARPDFFNWPAHFAEQLPHVNPSVIVVTFGGNDSQALFAPEGNPIVGVATGDETADAKWKQIYGQRVGEAMDQLTAGGRKLIWVGIPNDNDPDVTRRLNVQDQVVRAEVAKRTDRVVFIDTWARFSGRNGGWADFVIDPRDGQGKEVRQSDGFHLNETGAEILSLDIAEAIRTELRARGATL